MNQKNYQKELDRILAGIQAEAKAPRLFLHSCCAPCSSYVLEYLSQYFEITVYYYNPNIFPAEEYDKRVEEERRLIESMEFQHPVDLIAAPYHPEEFYKIARGYEKEPEGGERCLRCYELRLREAASMAARLGYDYFTTTLTISPLKRADKLNEIGERLAAEYGVACLPSDFKKKNGYKRSTELSKEYGLYRQDYCGCVYSIRNTDEKML